MLLEAVSGLILAVIIGFVIFWVLKERKQPEIPIQQAQVGNRMRIGGQGEGEEENKDDINEPKALGRKEIAKQARKEEKKKQSAARKAAIEDLNRRAEEKDEIRKKREDDQEKKELEEQERLKKIEEEKLKKEEEEYAQWKGSLVIESVGEEVQEESFTLEKFLEYIKLRKVVMIEDLANAFNLDGKTTVNRINELENTGHLSGILDDRGKYIYITPDEFLSFKKYIQARGRVSRLELCAEGNRLIRLNPTAEDKAKIEAEEKQIIEKEEKS
ncbi:hypothetical protein SteCoe_3159 [Stentor coeruleus]|uniref:DDRGK domain-containing protein 1 n=1 Tax=Stentor coeruleus TaxID=5963 RepID=A0A1R2CXY1_9CILI|nr:hypothetical protein SteCoe_3159 [Stentor coeruleus]